MLDTMSRYFRASRTFRIPTASTGFFRLWLIGIRLNR
jgi:hypothetical protein